MASSRLVRLSRAPRWDPTKHPRDPLGRFSLVGSVSRAQREFDDGLIGVDTMEGRIAAAGRQQPTSDWGDLSPISAEVRWRVDNNAFRGDSAEFGEMVEMNRRGEIDGAQFADLAKDWAGARKREQERRLAGQPTPSPPPASSMIVRDDEAEPSWSGYEGHTRAQTESDLSRMFDPDGGLVHTQVRDLSDGGVMNEGVRRVNLVDSSSLMAPPIHTEAVIKRASSAEEASAEVLASEVGRAIGAPSPVVVLNPDDNREIGMEAVPGSIGYNSGGTPSPREVGMAANRRYRENAARIAMMDQLVGNRDRHDGNWIMTDDSVPVGIDNGLAFGTRGEPFRSVEETRRFQQYLETNAAQSAGSWRRWTDRIPDEEIASWGPKLQALRPVFEAHGRLDWHDGMMGNWEYLRRERQR